MPLETLELFVVLPAAPAEIYRAWLDSREHALFTGGGPADIDPSVGGAHSAWDGYIWGKNLELEPDKRIVQSWRTTDFEEAHADSRVEVLLEPAPGGSKVTLRHTEIPEGQAEQYQQGWRDYYFDPMAEYFERLAGQPRPKVITQVRKVAGKAAPAAPAKKPAPAKKAAPKRKAAKPAKKAAKKPAPKKAAKPSKKAGAKRKAKR